MTKFSGFIDSFEDNTVSGWVWDADNPNTRFQVEITDRKGRTITTRAQHLREDLKSQNIGDGCYGFHATFPQDNMADSDPAGSFTAKVVNTDFMLLDAIKPQTSAKILPHLTAHAKNFGRKAAENLLEPISTAKQAIVAPEVPAMPLAKIVGVQGSRIDVYVDTEGDDCQPIVFVGRKPAWRAPGKVRFAGQPPKTSGYHFYISGIGKDDEISLWLSMENRLEHYETLIAPEASFERAILSQLTRAAHIARQPGAVAVTCWDGGHNPIGRAKVLYDVLKGNRPVVLFCFLFQDFGGDIWPPLANSDEAIVTIPWSQRHFYLRMAQSMGLQFETVWMCKPRAPTFKLAAYVAKPDARLILDMDDNEEHFSRSKGSRFKAYGTPSIGLSRALMNSVPARTAASGSLVHDFDATLVRHARPDARKAQSASPKKGPQKIKVGFIGTVRPHKRILEAAQRIRQMSQRSPLLDFEFHVYGDVSPASLHKDLEAEGAVVKLNIPANQLTDHLEQMDVVLTGFPSDSAEDKPITRYQISAKIGDGLSVGKPVLVPAGPSVADLAETEGVFPFTLPDFEAQMHAAAQLSQSKQVDLPESFTMEAAYQGFLTAEKAAEDAPRASAALSLVPTTTPNGVPAPQPTLLLLWKQHDGALYGRRMDLVCRAYRHAYPSHRVIILEFIYPDFEDRYAQETPELTEFAYISAMNIQKRNGGLTTADGTEYRQIRIEKSQDLNGKFLNFLGSNNLLPTNTVMVLFPNLLHLERIYDLLHPYPLLTDVVDNQLAWASGASKQRVIHQYFTLAQLSDHVVFNSARNQAFFQDNDFLQKTDQGTSVLPNWYQLPDGFQADDPEERPAKSTFDIVYSGNMNDRIDWDLMTDLAYLGGNVRLHLVGEARRSQEDILKLLDIPNVIYHGPMNEEMTLHVLRQADLTVMPHVVDDVSAYMNPLKVHMYAALGLPTISTDIPGIEASEFLTVCDSPMRFMAAVRQAIQAGPKHISPIVANGPQAPLPDNAQKYVALIDHLRTLPPREKN